MKCPCSKEHQKDNYIMDIPLVKLEKNQLT